MLEEIRALFKPTAKKDITLPTSQVGWSESQLYVGQIPKYNPDELIGRKGANIYKTMMVDEQVKAVVKFKRDAITSRNSFFELDDDRLSETEADKRIAIYDEMLKQVQGSFTDGLNYIMKATWQGFSLTEKVWDSFDYKGTPYLGLKKLAPKPFDTFEFFTDEFGEIKKTEQVFDSARRKIDLSRFVYFVQNPDMDQHYGQSELREAYRSWYAKDAVIRFYNMFIERLAGGLPIMKPDHVIPLDSPEYNMLKAILDHIQTTTSILLPPGVEFDLVQPQTSEEFKRAIELHDLQIAKALLVPNLLGITPVSQTGSFAQSQTQLEAFLWTLDSDAGRLEEAVNEQIFQPLSVMNFADGIGPRYKFKPISEQKKLELIKEWKELVSAGAVEATDTDEMHLRDLMDFPEKGEPLDLNPRQNPEQGKPDSGSPPKSSSDDDTLPDETVTGEQRRIVSPAAFDRAKRRVAVSVIDKKTTDILERGVDKTEFTVSELLADVSVKIIDNSLGTPATIAETAELKFDAKLKNELRKTLEASLQDGWNLGTQHSLNEVSKAGQEQFKIGMARLDTNAGEFIKSLAFRLVGDLTDSMMRTIQSILANAVKYSWTPRETVRKIYDRLTLAGFLHIETNAQVTGRTKNEILEKLAISLGRTVSRIRTILRTSLFETMNEARYNTFTDPNLEGFVVALEYSAILDSRTTDVCRHLDDRIYPVDDPVWNSYRPPNHFNCRSILIPVTIIDTEVRGKDPEAGERWSRAPRIEPQTGFGGESG